MRFYLCALLVCVLAIPAWAQFGKNPNLRNAGKGEDAAAAKTPAAKGAATARGERTGKADADPEAEAHMVGALLAAMDADKDGTVTKIEMNKAMAALRKVHKDSKGNMTVPENAPDPNAAVAGAVPGQQVPGGVAPAAQGAGAASDNEVMARFMQLDTNGDGRLSANEVPRDGWQMLRQADQDGDGRVSAAEAQLFNRRMGDRMRAWAAGVDPKNAAGAGVPGDGRKPPR
jgi:EF hand